MRQQDNPWRVKSRRIIGNGRLPVGRFQSFLRVDARDMLLLMLHRAACGFLAARMQTMTRRNCTY